MDRMEVIEISSYTENEKEHIAREHLIPKQIKANGLKESQLVIGDEVLKDIIEGYTKEAGVRNLERKFGEICRKSARKILQEKEKQVVITKDNLEDFLGRSRYTYQKVNEKDEVGIVRGLAWTSVGGDTLQIEVNLMPGKGEFSSDRTAWRCDERVCTGRYQLYSFCGRPVWYQAGIFQRA